MPTPKACNASQPITGNPLQTAMVKGQISLIEYVMEQTIYYEAAGKMPETERALRQSVAELQQYSR